MAHVILYKMNCCAGADTQESKMEYSLYSWEEAMQGEDDGGYEYVLPAGYSVLEQEGLPVIYNQDGQVCTIQSHNSVPLLIDESKKFAILLEREKKILNQREKIGLSRVELAGLLGVTQEQLYEWENCEKEPDMPILRRIAAELGCEVFDLT